MQPIMQLQWTISKATLENLVIYFLEKKNNVQ